jgi:N-acetylglucosaminyl-diphospho-decaprenol L-rhamnosyltransferase
VTTLETLTAVVVDWNLPDLTVGCVEALVADGVTPGRIVVVENGPTESNWARISAALPGCVLVRVAENAGFATAINLGAGVLPGSAYLLVNNDATPSRPGTVAALLEALARPRVGIVVPRLLNPDHSLQPSVVPFTTPLPALVRASGLSLFVPDPWQPGMSTHWSHDRSREIEAATGAVMLVEGGIWDRLGGLREQSFMYAEDIDLSWRADEAGVKTWFCAEAEFVHTGGASSGRRWDDQERWRRIAVAETEMIREHLSPAQAAVALGVTRLGVAARVACFTLLGKKDAAAGYRGFLAGMRSTAIGAESREGAVAPTHEVVRPHR